MKVRGFPDFSKGGVDFKGIVNASVSGGTINNSDRELIIRKADELILIIDIRTSYNNPGFKETCKKTIEKALIQEIQ